MRFQRLRILLSTALAACVTFTGMTPAYADGLNNLPSLGDAGGADLSVQDERRLGELIMRDYRAFGAVTEDPEISGYLNLLGAKIVQAAGESPANFEFFLVADPSVNAFALPGGFIGVHTGLLATARTESELASVLAHEVGHVTQRHIARMYGQQKQTSLVSTAAFIAAILVASSNPQAAQGLATAGVGFQAEQQLAFSREAEREADRIGFSTLERAGYETEGMVRFFGRLQQSSRLYENNAPSYLRTHPLTTERIADIQNRAGIESAGKPSTDAASLEFELLRMKALIYTDKTSQQLRDRMEALDASSALTQLGYTHPSVLLFGKALVLQKMDRNEQALAEIQKAIVQAKKEQPMVADYSLPLIMASQEIHLLVQQRIALNGGEDVLAQIRNREDLNDSDKQLLARLDQYIKDYKGSYSVRLQYAGALQSMGLFAESEDYLRDMQVLYRSRPRIYDLLAKAFLSRGKRAEYHLALSQSYALRGAYRPAIEQTQIARRYSSDDYYLTAEIEAKQREYKARADEERRYVENMP